MRRFPWSGGVACVGLILFGVGVRGGSEPSDSSTDRSPAPSESKRTARLHKVHFNEACAYDYYLDADHHQKLTLRSEPVMRWSSESDYHGDVYVWTDHGTPAVMGCIFSGPTGEHRRYIVHEFHSLALRPIFAGERGAAYWQPTEAGITPIAVPDEAEVGKTGVKRLAEMRAIARRFAAQMKADGRTWELRLLPQPIYRFEPTDESPTVVDGAVFVFVWTVGTDPEVLLVLETRRTDAGPRWHYAAARFTNREVKMKYRERDVWSADADTAGIFDGVTTKRYGAFEVRSIDVPADVPRSRSYPIGRPTGHASRVPTSVGERSRSTD